MTDEDARYEEDYNRAWEAVRSAFERGDTFASVSAWLARARPTASAGWVAGAEAAYEDVVCLTHDW